MIEFVPARRIVMAICCLAFAVMSAQPADAQDSEGGSIGGSIGSAPSGAPASSRHRGHAARPDPTPTRRASRAPKTEKAPRRSAERRGGGGGGFDGAWSVSAGGPCAAAGSNQISISSGHISGQGISGSVSSSGAVHTVGNINGLTVIGRGRISGNAASGTYRQSDGCSGPWSGNRL